ncbi:MAG TPA: serine/threonine-protein kinase [Methylomirabilota bacterium]|nr:serine/threonine-protein kinase [Methylomirabilota bacterium]
MTNASHCTACGHPLAEDGLGGVCASCLLKLVVEDGGTRLPEATADTGGARWSIPGYEIHEEIARGGMGIVYRAWQRDPERQVALKMLLPHQAASPGMRERFHLEARAIAALEHTAILPVYHVGEHNGLPFFTMKLATGGTLAQRKADFAGDWRRAAELAATLADAVQFAHERGVLHRDLKPGNVLFDEAGRAYVSDFGLAKLAGVDSDLTRSVEFLGTPHYAAPEVAAGSARSATIASDIYGLGAILYELLAGRPPFEAEGVPALLKKIAEEEPVPPRFVAASVSRGATAAATSNAIRSRRRGPAADPEEIGRGFTAAATSKAATTPVPRDLEVICLKCLAKEPTRRYASARDLAADLRRWLEGRTILARPATPWERVQSWARRNPTLALMGSALATVLVVAVIWQARSNRQLQHALSESLLRQAQLERSGGHAGQRFETLALAARAAEQWRAGANRMPLSNRVSWRSEVAAALALPDLRPTWRRRVHVSHAENEFDFTAGLDRYIAPAPEGGFTVFSSADHRPLHHVAGPTDNPVAKLWLHPGGSWAAARFADGHGELHLLPAAPESARRWYGTPNAGVIMAFDPTGGYLAAISVASTGDRMAEVIDLKAGVTAARVPATGATAMTFDGTGSQLALGGTALAVWRLADTNRLWSAPLSHHASALAWSADGAWLAVALDRRRPTQGDTFLPVFPVLIFEATSGRQDSTFGEFDSRVARLAFHPTSDRLAVATWQSGLVWGPLRAPGQRLFIEGAFRALRFSTDGTRLGYAPARDELGVLEVVAPATLHEWRRHSPATEDSFTLAASADGRWVATISSTALRLWDADRRKEIDSRPTPRKGVWAEVLFGPSNECLYYSNPSFGVRRVTLTNAADGGLRLGEERLVGEPRGFIATRFAPDGRSLVVGDHRRVMQGERVPLTVWLWPEADPARARKLADGFPLNGYRPLRGGRFAVTTHQLEPDVWIWDFESGQRLRSLGIPMPVSSEPTQNGRWLVTRTTQGFAVWEVGTWKRLSQWPARADEAPPMNIFSSPDSRMIGTHNPGGRFVLRELPGGNELLLLTPPHPISVQHYQFSPDSTRLFYLSGNGRLFDWDLAQIRAELAKLHLDW